jgi:hypothetical protein
MMNLWKWAAAPLLALLSVAPSYAQWPRHSWGPQYRNPPYGRWYNPPQWNNQYQPPPPPQWNNPYQQPGQGVGTVWVYSLSVYGTPSQGSWRDLGNGQWVETNPTGQWNYVEVGRGPNFVDLLDQNRNLVVRLTPTQQYQRSVNDPNWTPNYSGRWVQ